MPSKARRAAILKTSKRAAHVGAAALKQRINRPQAETTDSVQPFPHPQAERSEEIGVRLQFLLSRRNRGEASWSDLAIAECRAELERALEQERDRRQ